MKLSKLLAASVTSLLMATSAQAALVYSSSNDQGSWSRPVGTGPGISGLGPVDYSVQAFFTDLSGLYDISSTQNYDGYIHLYQNAFDPLDQLQGLLAADDDGNGGIGTSDIENFALSSGIQYYLVTSAFAFGDSGTFTNTIDGGAAANVQAGMPNGVIPLPGTMMLMGLGVLGFGLARRS